MSGPGMRRKGISTAATATGCCGPDPERLPLCGRRVPGFRGSFGTGQRKWAILVIRRGGLLNLNQAEIGPLGPIRNPESNAAPGISPSRALPKIDRAHVTDNQNQPNMPVAGRRAIVAQSPFKKS